MRKFRNIIIFIALLGFTLFLFRGNLYRAIVGYKEDGQRTNYIATDKRLISFIEENLSTTPPQNIDEIVDLSQKITNKALSFHLDSKDANPNKTIETEKANCIGYAAFTASTANYLINKYNLSKEWEAKPFRGKLYVFGEDIHRYITNKSFKDHDFVIFKNKSTGQEISIDPTIYSYLRIDRIRNKNR